MLLIGRQLHCSACYTNSVVMPKDGSSSFEKMIGGHFTLGGHFTHISPTCRFPTNYANFTQQNQTEISSWAAGQVVF
jgi:hypothetical protein